MQSRDIEKLDDLLKGIKLGSVELQHKMSSYLSLAALE